MFQPSEWHPDKESSKLHKHLFADPPIQQSKKRSKGTTPNVKTKRPKLEKECSISHDVSSSKENSKKKSKKKPKNKYAHLAKLKLETDKSDVVSQEIQLKSDVVSQEIQLKSDVVSQKIQLKQAPAQVVGSHSLKTKSKVKKKKKNGTGQANSQDGSSLLEVELKVIDPALKSKTKEKNRKGGIHNMDDRSKPSEASSDLISVGAACNMETLKASVPAEKRKREHEEKFADDSQKLSKKDISSKISRDSIKSPSNDEVGNKTDRNKKKKKKFTESNAAPLPFNRKKLQSILSTNKAQFADHINYTASDHQQSEIKPSTSEVKSVEAHPRKKSSGPKSLRDKMQERLQSARFRFLNEQLYTSTGQDAYEMFSKDQSAFQVYHEGFQSQVEKWPVNPVDIMIQYIRQRPGNQVVADFGCGAAQISTSVPHQVHSFDLVALNDNVTVCDIANVPLKDKSVDVAVFCLSLMGTNLTDFISEANRVLKKKGTLLVAEVISRFEKVGAFVRKMAKMGFDLVEKREEGKMFIWLEFVKISPVPPVEAQPRIELSPCQYKRR